MNSLERVRVAIDHREPDRVPVELGWAPELFDKLRVGLGFDDGELLEWIGNDLVQLGPTFREPRSEIFYADPTIEVTEEGHYLDIWRVPFKQVRTDFQVYVDLAGCPPLRGCGSLGELDEYPWPGAELWDYGNVGEDLDENAEKACWGHSRGLFWAGHIICRRIRRLIMWWRCWKRRGGRIFIHS